MKAATTNFRIKSLFTAVSLLSNSIWAQSQMDFYSNSYQGFSGHHQPSPQQGALTPDDSQPFPAPQSGSPPFFGQPPSHPAPNNFAVNLPNPTNVIQPASFNSQYLPIKPQNGFQQSNAPAFPENYFSWVNAPNPQSNANTQPASSENNGMPAWTHSNTNTHPNPMQQQQQNYMVHPNAGNNQAPGSFELYKVPYKVPHLPVELVDESSSIVPPFQPQPNQGSHFGNYVPQGNLPHLMTFTNGQNGAHGVLPPNVQAPVGNHVSGQPSAFQPPPPNVQVDQNNLQRYAQYLEILQKHYGIKMPGHGSSSSETNNMPSISSNTLPISPSNGPNAAPNGYSIPPQPAPQPPNYNNFNSWPNFPPNSYVPQGHSQQTNPPPNSAVSIVNNPMPSLPSPQGTGYNGFNNYANIPPPSPHGQPYGVFPPPQQPSPNVDYMSGQVHILPETHNPTPITPPVNYPQYTWTPPPSTTTTLITTTTHRPPPTRPSLEYGEATTAKPAPPTTGSTTSIQALTQQIRRLPAVLYVDSRNEEARKTENLLREVYGLPLVAFYVDKIDKPKAVERNLQQLTAHKGLPYLFICGTFIGSQQHIDSYHSNKQIPQLVEYVCGDEKKRKAAKKAKKSSS